MSSTTTPNRTRVAVLVVGAAAIAAVAIFAFAGGGGDSVSVEPLEPGTTVAVTPAGPPAPDLPFTYFDGSEATLAAYQGRPTVVNFWASWCPSCVAEMSAAFRPAQQQLGDTVAFVGFNIQDERSRALELVEETGVLFDLAEDPRGDLYAELGGLGMPFTVFINENGEIVHKHNGPVTEQQLLDLIDERLDA